MPPEKTFVIKLSERLLNCVRRAIFKSDTCWDRVRFPVLVGYRKGHWLVDGMEIRSSSNCARSHTLVAGAEENNVMGYLRLRMQDAMRRKRGLLYIDCKGSLASLELLKASAAQYDRMDSIRVLNFCGDPNVMGFRFNPLANWSPRCAASWLEDLFGFKGRFHAIMPSICSLRDKEGVALDLGALLKLCEVDQLKAIHADERIPQVMRSLLDELLLQLQEPILLAEYEDDLRRLYVLAEPMLTTYASIFESRGNVDSMRLDLSRIFNSDCIVHASFKETEPGNVTAQALLLALKWEAIGMLQDNVGKHVWSTGYEGAVVMLNDFQHYGILKRTNELTSQARKHNIELIFASGPEVFEMGGVMETVLGNTSTKVLLADNSGVTPDYFWKHLHQHRQSLTRWHRGMQDLRPGEGVLFSYENLFNRDPAGAGSMIPRAERIRF